MEAQGPRATRPRKSAQSHTREGPTQTVARRGRVWGWIGPCLLPRSSLTPSQGPRPVQASGLRAVLRSRSRSFSTSPGFQARSQLPGCRQSSCTPGSAGEPARPSLTREPGAGNQEPQLRQRRPRRPPLISFQTAVCAPAGRPSPSRRHFRHSNRPPMAGPSRGNPPGPASPGVAGVTAQGKARASRTRTGARGPLRRTLLFLPTRL